MSLSKRNVSFMTDVYLYWHSCEVGVMSV